MKNEEIIKKLAEEAIKLRDREHYAMKDAVYAVLDRHNVQHRPTRKQLDSDISRLLRMRRTIKEKAKRERRELALTQPMLPF